MKMSEVTQEFAVGHFQQINRYIVDTLGFDKARVSYHWALGQIYSWNHPSISVYGEDTAQHKDRNDRPYREGQLAHSEEFKFDEEWDAVITRLWEYLQTKVMPLDERELRFMMKKMGCTLETPEFKSEFGRMIMQRLRETRDEATGKLLEYQNRGRTPYTAPNVEPAPQHEEPPL